MRPDRPRRAAVCYLVVGTAIVITPLAAGASFWRHDVRAEGLLSSRLYGRPRNGQRAFTGSCAVGRSRAIPPIRELHPCPEDRLQEYQQRLREPGSERSEVAVA